MEEGASSSRSASDEDRRVRFEDVTDEPEDLSTTGLDNNDPPDEDSGSESGDETRDTHTQLKAMCPKSHPKQATADCSPDVNFELQANSTVSIGGNMYSHVRVSNDARLHLGDSITINNYHCDPKEDEEEHIVVRVEIVQEFLMTLSAAVGLVRALLQTTTGLFLLLQFTMSAYRLPKQMNDQLVTFEDALGRFQRIDLLFIKDWPAFKQRLQSDFHGTSGSRRILEMKYRLCDRVKGNYLVDPRFPPPFTSVFKHGRHVQMSIHFEWNEVSDEKCPRCGLEQECNADRETICAQCGFSYRSQVDGARVGEVDESDDEEPEHSDGIQPAIPARPKPERVEADIPLSFSRITISKQPPIFHHPRKANFSQPDTTASPGPFRFAHPLPELASRPLTPQEAWSLYQYETHARACHTCYGGGSCDLGHRLTQDVRVHVCKHDKQLCSTQLDSEGRWTRVVIPRGYGWTKAMLGVKRIPLSKKPKRSTTTGSVKPAPQGEERRSRRPLERYQVIEVADPDDSHGPVRTERMKRGSPYESDLRQLTREYRRDGVSPERQESYERVVRVVRVVERRRQTPSKAKTARPASSEGSPPTTSRPHSLQASTKKQLKALASRFTPSIPHKVPDMGPTDRRATVPSISLHPQAQQTQTG